MTDFLAAADERILILDGAFGTWVQAQDLGPDDFGGRRPRGLQRAPGAHPARSHPPDARRVLRGGRRRGRDRHVRRLRTRARRVRPRRPGVRDERRRGTASHRRRPRRSAPRTGHAGWSAAIGPGTRLPSLGAITFEALRTDYQEQAAGLIEGGADVLLVETVYDLLQAKAALIACRRAMADAGRELPLMVQVTDGDHGSHARRLRDRRRADRARGDAPRRHRAQLRDRARSR